MEKKKIRFILFYSNQVYQNLFDTFQQADFQMGLKNSSNGHFQMTIQLIYAAQGK